MNTKQTALLFFDIAVGNNELGRVFVEPLPSAQSFLKTILYAEAKCKTRSRMNAMPLANVTEVKRNSFVKFSWNLDSICGQMEEMLDDANENDAFFTLPTTSSPVNCTSPSEIPNGLVIVPANSPNEFYVLTSTWSMQDIQGEVVGCVYKGMDVIQQVSWMNVNSDSKSAETCSTIAVGFIEPGIDLGIRQRDALLDPYSDTPNDSGLDFQDFEKLLHAVCKIKASGSLLFRESKYQMALFRFGKAVRYLSCASERQKFTHEQEMRALQIIVSCILNSAASRLKLRDFDGALEDCNEAMELSPNDYKVFFRRGQAHHGKMNYEQSLSDLYAALNLSPNDRAIKNEIAAVEGEMQVYKKTPSRRNSTQTPMQTQ